MENIIRQIIKEELQKALLEFEAPVSMGPSEDEIIGNFEAGRAFGINKLARDIKGLGEYYMNDYFPRSEMEEGWMFEIETNYGGSQLIEIAHRMSGNYESYWKLDISELSRGSNVPAVSHTSKFIKGYKNFVDVVNSTLKKEINPKLL